MGDVYDDEPQSVEEMDAQIGKGSAALAVHDWLNAIFEGPGLVRVWGGMDDTLRLCRAQAWLYNNREHPYLEGRDLHAIADRWAAGDLGVASKLWAQFDTIERQALIDAWGGAHAGQLAAATRPRPIGLDLELVILLPTEGEILYFDQPTLVSGALNFLMRQTDGGWKVAAFCDQLPVPGWPPSFD